MFDDYVHYIESKTKCEIDCFVFRDKRYGWGTNGQYSGLKVVSKKGKLNQIREYKVISSESSSYYRYFLSGDIYRDCCYDCPFATGKRVGDLTIGDYWGIEKYNPELLAEYGGSYDRSKGISCVLANTQQGLELLQRMPPYCEFKEVECSNVIKGNTQLRRPVALTRKRERLMGIYERKGYCGIDKYYEKELKIINLKKRIYRWIAQGVTHIIKRKTNR